MSRSNGRWLRLILHGRAALRQPVRDAVETLRDEGHRVEVRVTWEAGDALRLAREAAVQGVETVVAGGGDGTLNEVVAGLVDGSGPPRASVALVPLGTGNDFAHCCDLPIDDPEAALRLAAESEPRPIDLGTASGRVFVNVASGGFGSRLTAETPPELKRALGGISYLLTGLRRFNDFTAESGRLEAPEFSWEGRFHVLAVGNGRQAGGGIELCPQAELDDGLLDVLVLPDVPEAERFEKLASLVREGWSAIEREGICKRVPWLEVDVPSGLHVNLDGEPTHATHLRFAVRHHWLRFHLPPTSPPGRDAA